nr:aminotransferase class III-fold pyridoxal phosphate-dependent enzyme [Rhodovulum sulfidophilum]
MPELSRQQAGALATGGNRGRRSSFAPLMIETSLIAPCVAYRGQAEGESEAAYGQRMAGELETASERPRSETVLDAAPGTIPAVPGYFRRTREICDCHGGLPILDKRICGMGRTETPFACDRDGIAPDIAAIAKGLGAGSQPVGAMLCTASMTPSKRAVAPSRTDTPSWPGTGRSRGRRSWAKGSRRPCARPLASPHVGDIRGQNLFRGIEQAKDRASRPLPARAQGPCPDRGRRFRGRAALPSDGRHH